MTVRSQKIPALAHEASLTISELRLIQFNLLDNDIIGRQESSTSLLLPLLPRKSLPRGPISFGDWGDTMSTLTTGVIIFSPSYSHYHNLRYDTPPS